MKKLFESNEQLNKEVHNLKEESIKRQFSLFSRHQVQIFVFLQNNFLKFNSLYVIELIEIKLSLN